MVVYIKSPAGHVAGVTVQDRITSGFSCDVSCITLFERMLTKAVRAHESDYRDWEAIDAWAGSTARDRG